MRVVIVRHHLQDSAGFIATAFQARGAEFIEHLFPQDGPLPAPDGFDHIVVLGAVFAVYSDGADSAWIADELAWLRQADEAGVPVLGICFGAQALAAAFGGGVEAAPRREIGWTMIDSLDPGLIPPGPWLEFHGDRCLLPRQARLLACSDVGAQAFSLGRHLGVQFHPEVDGEQLVLWLDDCGREMVEREGQDPDQLVAETIAQEPAASDRADSLVTSALRIAGRAGPPQRVTCAASGIDG
jgi:GMP synthase-like glutamine amidotransferase